VIYSPFEPTRVVFFTLGNYVLDFFTINFIFVVLFLFFTPIVISTLLKMDSTVSFVNAILVSLYSFVFDLVYSYIKNRTNILFSFFLYIFLFVFISNIFGLIPFFFAITSHFSTAVSFCLIIWFSILTLGFSFRSIHFINTILPRGIPFLLVWFLISIELISYIFRFISLSLRLFANIVAGHILIHVVNFNIYSIFFDMTSGFTLISSLLLLLGSVLLIVFILFELAVAFLQSYIILVLSLIYSSDIFSDAH